MADGKFIEFLFEPGLDFPNSTRYKVAYQSLVNKPEQLFALLLDEEKSKIFLSGFESYGKQLARLLEGPPEFFKSASENQLQPKRDDIKLWLFGEALSVFLFSLIANDYLDIGSQESIADIAMAVIKLSRSGRTLELLGARLGEAPLILSRLIASSSMGAWSRSHPELFKSIVSGDKTLVSWTKTIADLAERCTFHIDASRSVPTWIEMQELVQSFPCNWCRPTASDGIIENPAPRLRDFNLNKMGPNVKTFDRLLGEHLGPWKIILSAQALKDLKEAAHNDSEVFDHIRERLFALASGDWMRRSLRRPTKPEHRYKVPVYQVSCRGNVVILWQVDVAFDERHDHDFQAIKVWAISAYLEVEKMCESIIQAQGTYTSARVAACQTKDLEKIKRTIYPAYVHLTEASDESDAKFATAIDSEASPIVADRRMIEGSPLLGKFYSLTTVVLDNVHPGALSAVFPVDVSGEEVNIINFFQRPAFILGRSGTGKTTCLIYKLASRYLSSRIIDEAPVRQLLLTRSKNLAQKLRLYTKRLINTRMGIIDVDFQEGETEAAWDDTEEDTTQNLLSLGDQDFPLVCTFNYFLRLLENTIDGGNQRNQRLARKMEKPPKPVDFVTFSIDYWGRFPRPLKQRIPIDLAFIDIMGVIKGSASVESGLEPLSRDAYVSKRWRLAPNFATDSERNAVYTLYEHYENIKHMRGEVDNTDRVISVLKALKRNPELQNIVEGFLDEVYVDEVQDQRPLEIEVLLALIRDPWGIHFAGDTAQSISKDSLFRFANAKALFYTRFSKLVPVNGSRSFLKPELLPLSHNFRSHKGILSLASLVMELLYTGFPDLVDKLPPEIGDNEGPKPILYIGSGLLEALQDTEKTAQEEKSFEEKGSAEGEKTTEADAEVTEFGEERVILVRDERTQSELEPKIGNSALVLTILQSKGMEFEDVFLYNFFTSSPYSSDFKILEDLLNGRYSSGVRGTKEPARHAEWAKEHIVLCSELKHLYVGVTRARTRLWIVESDEQIVPPIIKLFNKTASALFPKKYPESLVEVLKEGEFKVADLRKRFHTTNQTSSARWRELGYELMNNKAYAQASTCFKRAKDKGSEALADAYLVELRGMEYRAKGLRKEFISAFEDACELFRKAGRIAKAVECQMATGNYVAAGEIWSQSGAHEEAAFMFSKANKPKKAAQEYHEMGKHEKALATYFYTGFYNELAKYLKDISSDINSSCRKQNSRLCYVLLINEKVLSKLRATAISSLGSETEQENTFREFGMMNDVFELYEKQKRYGEAYEVAVRIGFFEEALRLVNDKGLYQSVQRSILCDVFYYIQTQRILADKPVPKGSKSGQIVYKNIAISLKKEANTHTDNVWEGLSTDLKEYLQSLRRPDRSHFQDEWMKGLCDLLVTEKTPKAVCTTPDLDLARLPLEFIDGAIDILCAIISDKTLPYSARLFLGLYEFPDQRGEYIAIQRSFFYAGEELKFPTQYLDTQTTRDRGCKLIFDVILAALNIVDQCSQKPWEYGIFQNRDSNRRLMTAQFSTDLRALLSLNLLFSNIQSIRPSIPSNVEKFEPVIQKRGFWLRALIRQLSYASSYEQDVTILDKAKHELKFTTPKFQKLFSRLQGFFLSEVAKVAVDRKEYLSSRLQQMQFAEYLDVRKQCRKIFNDCRPQNDQQLVTLFEVVELTQVLRDNRGLAYFPGKFYENVRRLLSRLEQIQSKIGVQLSFYSPSVISLYEELITLLILLVRPTYFMIPRSFALLHLSKWTKVHRSTSEYESSMYRSLLIKVVISFCRLVRHIEDYASGKVKDDNLALRSLHLIVVSIINIGTLTRRPHAYLELWTQAQMVFNYNSLKATQFKGVLAHQLLAKLVKAFDIYDGKDKLGVVVTDGHKLPTGFEGLPLAGNGIPATYMGIPKPQTRRRLLFNPAKNPRELSNPIQKLKQISAAYLITLFWRRNGQQFVARMKRERMRRERAYLAQRRKPRVCLNCCILAEMRYSKDLIY